MSKQGDLRIELTRDEGGGGRFLDDICRMVEAHATRAGASLSPLSGDEQIRSSWTEANLSARLQPLVGVHRA